MKNPSYYYKMSSKFLTTLGMSFRKTIVQTMIDTFDEPLQS